MYREINEWINEYGNCYQIVRNDLLGVSSITLVVGLFRSFSGDFPGICLKWCLQTTLDEQKTYASRHKVLSGRIESVIFLQI